MSSELCEYSRFAYTTLQAFIPSSKMLYSTPEMLSQLRIAIQKDNFSDGAASLNVKVFSICAITEMIFVFQLSGIFQPPHTERELVIVWGNGEVTTRGTLQKATQWPANDTSPNIQMGNRKHTSCSLGYCSKDDYEREWQREWQYLEQQLHLSQTIPGVRKLHLKLELL